MLPAAAAALNRPVPDNLPVLSRPRNGAMIGGVCAGLARRWHVDPNLLRIAVAVLVLFGGLGLAAYGAGVLLMPRDGQTEMPVRRWLPFTRDWPTAGVVAATIGALVLLTGIPTNGIGFGPVAVIFAVWYFGFRNHGTRTNAPTPEPTPFERQAEAWRDRLAEQQTPGYAPASGLLSAASLPAPTLPTSQQAPQWQQPYTNPADLAVRDNLPPAMVAARQRRRRFWLLAALLSGVGVALVTVLGVVFGLPLGPLPYFAAILAALGMTLVASSKVGRPRGMLFVTIVTALLTAALMSPVPASVGETAQVYRSVDELPRQIDLGAGEIALDLSAIRLDSGRAMDIKLGAGEVDIILPADGNTLVSYHIGAGTFDNSVHSNDGVDVKGSQTFGSGTGTPVLQLNIDVGMGEVTVRT